MSGAANSSLHLPYIGINIERLPDLVGTIFKKPSGSRSALQLHFSEKYGCSIKTAKEYVASLKSLHLIHIDQHGQYQLRDFSEAHRKLLLAFATQRDYSAFLSYLASVDPSIETFRALYGISFRDLPNAPVTALANHIGEELRARGVTGSTSRQQTLQAFVRLLQASQTKGAAPSPAPPLDVKQQRRISRLPASLRAVYQNLVTAVANVRGSGDPLSLIKIVSLGDVAREMKRDLATMADELFALQDYGMISLHATIAPVAKNLNIPTISRSSAHYSGISLMFEPARS